MEGTIGEIRMFAGNFEPRTWAFCKGQLLSISSNTALFSILGTTYGGDGRNTMGLPDLRGRVPIGAGQGPGLSSYREGQKGGLETVILNTTQIPSHNHSIGSRTGNLINVEATAVINADTSGSTSDPSNGFIGQDTNANIYGNRPDTTLNPGSVTINASLNPSDIVVGNTGGNLSHENRQPYLTCYYIICLQGVYPSRS